MKVLGIETTCDETSFAIVDDGHTILSHTIASQIDIHKQFGGVVPELACRYHIDTITPLLYTTLQQANISLSSIDLIAVARGPGLIGALLIGINFAKGLAYGLKKPLVGVNHIEAHLYASMMSCTQEKQQFPALGVVLSGGHTSLVIIHDIGKYELLGETIDDAIGEAFDKIAKILSLPYPGGPEIERLAVVGDPLAFPFKGAKLKEKPFHFSFSGLKTSVLYTVQKNLPLTDGIKKNIAAAFQQAAFDDVVGKVKKAVQIFPLKAVFLGGGVTQNKYLRSQLAQEVTIPIYWPARDLCLDNAAMIAGLGYHKFLANPTDILFTIEPETRMAFT